MQTTSGYRGRAMHPSLGGRSPSGGLSIVAGEIRFDGGDVYVQMPLSGLQVQVGGYNNEQLMFQHSSRPGWVLSSSDPRFLGELSAASDKDLRCQLSFARKRKVAMTTFYIAGAVFLVIIGGAVLLLFLLKSTLARAVANRLPYSLERQLGDSALGAIRKEMQIIENPEWEAQLDVIRARLLPGITNTTFPIKLHVAESKDLNAFALPGGHIVVFTGLLKAVERPEELAGVIAHEIAHINERHVLRRTIESLGLVLVIQALFGDTSGLLAVATQSSEKVLQQKFSRDFEREADDVGWKYLVAANINPRGMIDFFAKLQKDAANSQLQLGLLAAHPPTAERIGRLEAKWKELAKRDFPPLTPAGAPGKTP